MQTVDEAYVQTLIDTAHRAIYKGKNVSLLPTEWQLITSSYPFGGGKVTLPHPPLMTVESVQFYDANNNLVTVDESYYTVRPGSPGFVVFDQFFTPTLYNRPDAFIISYTAGYPDAASVPATFKHACKLMIGHYYENRSETFEGSLTELPMGIQALLDAEDPCSWG